MAIPSVRAVGTVASSTGAITPGMPAGTLAGDILLLFLGTRNQAITVSGGTETWTQAADSPVTRGAAVTGVRLTVFWARASQDAPTSPTTSDSGNMQQGRIIAISGCIASGDPTDDTASDTNFGTISFPGVTTTVADCLVVFAGVTSIPDADSTTEFSSFSFTGLTSITEQIDNTTSQGNGGGLCAASGGAPTATTYSGGTCTAASGDSDNVGYSIALKPALSTSNSSMFLVF